MREVGRWLTSAGLAEYGPRFEADGCDLNSEKHDKHAWEGLFLSDHWRVRMTVDIGRYDELATLRELASSASDVDELVADMRSACSPQPRPLPPSDALT